MLLPTNVIVHVLLINLLLINLYRVNYFVDPIVHYTSRPSQLNYKID